MKRDVILYWPHGWLPKGKADLMSRFVHPVVAVPIPGTSFRQSVQDMGWPNPIHTYLAKQGIEPARIATIGFSASCQGVSQLLRSNDAGVLDTVIAIDGIHDFPTDWITFGRIAAYGLPEGSPLPRGKRTLVITHSSVVPPGYKSTTELAKIIHDGVLHDAPVASETLPWLYEPIPWQCQGGTKPVRYAATKYDAPPLRYDVNYGGFHVFGYNNLEATGVCDHIYQSQVILPLVFEKMLLDPWNREDPATGVCGLTA